MIAGLRSYPVMKDSGVPWLGAVPTHWEVGPLKRFAARRPGAIKAGPFGSQLTANEMIEEDVKVYTQRNVIDRNFREGTNYISNAKFEVLRTFEVFPGDVLVTSRGTIGRTMLVTEDCERGILHPCLIRVQPDQELLIPEFLMALIQDSQLLPQQLTFLSNATTIDVIYSGTLANIVVPAPPPPEQTAIVRYLDHADRRIRRYIRAKQKLIALLEEQKQAIIHQAVTGQIDVRTGQPYPAYKPSGVEWLGDVPAHWEGLALKRWVSTKITDGPHETPIFQDAGVPFMSAESMVEGKLDFSRRRGFILHEQHEFYCRKCRPQRHDIFMCKSGATTGKVAIVETDDEFSVWSPLALVRVDPDRVLPRLLFAVLSTHYVQRQVQDTWSYGTQPNLSMGAMERLFVVLPPIDEQRQILTYIDQALKEPSKAIDRARRQNDLLPEFRTRLIADVVTGKLDVREVAAALPEDDLDETDATLEEAEA